MTTLTDLSHVLNGWQRRLRFQRGLTWAARGLVCGLALALVIGLAGLLLARLVRAEFVALAVSLPAALALTAGVAAYLWRLDALAAARFFDRRFGLRERVSTALELSRQNSEGILIRQQLQDALVAARGVEARRAMPLRLQAREPLLAAIFVLLLGLAWLRGGSLFAAAQQTRAVGQAVATQAAQIQQTLTEIQHNEALSDAQKQALSAPLEQALNGLKTDPSQAGSVSVLTSAGEQLSALSSPQAAQMAQALQNAGSKLAAQKGSPLQQAGQALAAGNIPAAANQLAQTNVNNLSPAQASQLAGQLSSLAQSLAASNPQLSTQLNQAAQALQSGNSVQAQQALNQAAQSLAQAGQQQAFSQAAGQAAQQMQQGAGQVLAAGGGQQSSTQAGLPGSSQNPQAGQAGGSGSGKGSAQGSPTGAGQAAGSTPIQQGNGPGDGGETTYQQIYAPSLLGGSGGPSVNLPSSGQGGTTIGQGPAGSAQPGQSLVPYQQVYSQYQQGNLQAIENGSIPFEFMQTIRNYFSSLNP